MLRTFGCACWPNLRLYTANKLQFQSQECVLIGYSNLHKGYKCLHKPSGHVYLSRDVVFDELKFPFSKDNHPFTDIPVSADSILLPILLSSFVTESAPIGGFSTNASLPRDQRTITGLFPVGCPVPVTGR